jgi:pimeloyl-ACP methyl ester carboxylesterase
MFKNMRKKKDNPQRLYIVLLILFSFFCYSCDSKKPTTSINGAIPFKSGYIPSGKIKLFYVTAGKGPLIVLLHGFPEFWFSWKQMIPLLAKNHQVVAIDLRGYNKSDAPKDINDYLMKHLEGDVESVRKFFRQKKFILVGHDWGGIIAWYYSKHFSQHLDGLVTINTPHPHLLALNLRNNEKQKEASNYIDFFLKDFPNQKKLIIATYERIIDQESRKEFITALDRTNISSMTAFYKANMPNLPSYKAQKQHLPFSLPDKTTNCPTLMIFGLRDPFLLQDNLNESWKMVNDTLTLVTLPEVGHFPHEVLPEKVSQHILSWIQTIF